MQCYSGKGDVVKTNIYLPFSLHQSWHPALNSLPLPRYCGKATEQESSPSISCCWPKKQKGTEKKRTGRELEVCKLPRSRKLRFNTLTFVGFFNIYKSLKFSCYPGYIFQFITASPLIILQYFGNPSCYAQTLSKLQLFTVVTHSNIHHFFFF